MSSKAQSRTGIKGRKGRKGRGRKRKEAEAQAGTRPGDVATL